MIIGANGAPVADAKYPHTADELKTWVIATASSGDMYIGKVHGEENGTLLLLRPAYEYKAQHVVRGEELARQRSILPIEMMPQCESIRVRVASLLKLEGLTDVDLGRLFTLVKAAQEMQRHFLVQQSAMNVRQPTGH